MGKRGIVVVTGLAVIALSGCATEQRTTSFLGLTESDVRQSVLSPDLVGTWNGSFRSVVDDGGIRAIGILTLVIKEDGTYTLIERRGASMWSYAGVVVDNGRAITLQPSSGSSVSLKHRGDTLYGMAHDRNGYMVHISVEKDSGALASPPQPESD